MSAYIWDLLSRPGASAGAIILSVISAAILALLSIRANRKTTRDRETIAIINQYVWDKDYLEAKDKFVELRDGAGLQACCADPKTETARAVAKIMNHYELLSIGINRGILSGTIYSDFYRTRFIKDWQAAQSYIHTIRDKQGKNMKIFSEFEKLAQRWLNETGRPWYRRWF